MKKAPGEVDWGKPVKSSYDSFVDEFSESQQLQEQLNTIVHDLHVTVAQLEQNLQKAHQLARPQHKTR